MKIAIDASRAFLHERTGIEEYSYQLIKSLREHLKDHDVTLFVRSGTQEKLDFELPPKWRVKALWFPRFWTYIRLSLALLWRGYDRLFVPGHIVPPIHPRETIATVHGLEFEMMPESYSFYERKSMRYGIKRSCTWAKRIICVSNNTKRDLIKLYDIPRKKMRVIYEGINPVVSIPEIRAANIRGTFGVRKGEYLIFIGRLETRKNIINIIKAFEMLKAHFQIPHKLIFVGKSGHGWKDIEAEISVQEHKKDIIFTGFVSEEEKWALLTGASIFVFPTLYEGFGLPILEAQQVGVPVVASQNSAAREIVRESALLVNPHDTKAIAEAIHILIADEKVHYDIIKKGEENLLRFGWTRAAKLTAKMILAGKKS